MNVISDFGKTIKATFIISVLLFTACNPRVPITENKPNILWIYLEDTSPLLSCYGNSIITTPNIDALAKNGTLFTHAFMPAPVCSPCRSSIITGMMSTSLGVHNHHSSRTEESAIHLPDYLKTIPEVFQSGGYFTFNNGKDDYNFSYDRKQLYSQDYYVHPLYGKKGEAINLTELADKTPFFGQIQLSGGKEIFSASFKDQVSTPADRSAIQLPPFLPHHPAIIEEYANHLDAIQITDRKVGEIMNELKAGGFLDNTIVFFFSDHGMRLTRHKQFLYDGGLHVPLIIADFRKNAFVKAASTDNQLVSGLDLGISSLALAGIPIPDYMEGKNIFEEDKQKRKYLISSRDRCDFTIDRIRAVRSKRYKYIRNFMTDRPYSQPTYMDFDGVEFVRVIRQLHRENKLDSIQSRFFANERPTEELYDLENDPFEINNLAGKPEYVAILQEHADILAQWITSTDDKGQYPENEENLKLMLGIWGEHAINPEYEPLRKKYPDLAGSLFEFKNQSWQKIVEAE